MAAIAKGEFTKRLFFIKRAEKIRKAREEERFLSKYTIESCVQSIEQRRKYLNGRRDF